MAGQVFAGLGPDGGCELEDAVQAAVAGDEHNLREDGGHRLPPQMCMAKTENLTTSANIDPPKQWGRALPMRRRELFTAPAPAG